MKQKTAPPGVELPNGANNLSEQDSTAPNTTESATTRVHFDINVPVYVSNALRVRVVWVGKDLIARWVVDESWAVSDDFPTNTENQLVVTFSDGNGAITLGSFEAVFKTGSNESEIYQVVADQFETKRWDDDGDGLSNLDESIAGTNPLEEDVLEPVDAAVDLVADKTFRINWQPTKGAQFYRVLENADGLSGFTQISDDLDFSVQVFDYRIALYKKVNARYIVQACNSVGCVDSEEVIMSGTFANAIGYIKASNPDIHDNFGESVALNSDGTVLAIGTYLEDSTASGVNGNQSDNSAVDTGAVYVFVRSSGRWQQQAYL